MRLNKETEKLLINLVKNKTNLSEYTMELYKNKTGSVRTELNGRLRELNDLELVNVSFAGNIAYAIMLTHKAEDYIEENNLSIELFDGDTLMKILKTIGYENGIDHILVYDIDSCGNSQIGWRQTDEYEWELKIEAIADILLVKRISNKIESELRGYGYRVIEKIDDDSTIRFKRNIKFANSLGIRSEQIQDTKIYKSDSIELENKEDIKTMGESGMNSKKPKIFISHSSKDIKTVTEIVNLFEDLGLRKENLFCSSVPGYDIPLNEDIYEYLKNQFHEYDLHVIFVLSQNYYDSIPCLNEMGAAWVLKSNNTMILMPGFEYKEIKGAVNPRQISIKLDAENEELKSKLGDLKDILIEEFDLSKIMDVRWERKRNAFIENINTDKVNDDANKLFLCEKEKIILKNMSQDLNGQLVKSVYIDGTTIYTNEIQLNKTDERRELAEWEGLIKELQKKELIISKGKEGKIFEITSKGYEIADTL